MGYLISQIYLCLVVAAVIGGLIGYLLKQFEERKSAERLETTWSEKVLRASRELDTLRSDLKMQTQRYEDLERESDADQARLMSSKNELAAEKERVAGLTASMAEKDAAGTLLESSSVEMNSAIEQAQKQIAGLESSLHARAQTIEALEQQVDQARVESASLAARIAELEPLTARLNAANKSLSEADARYSAFAAEKKAETSALKNRLAGLEPLTVRVREWELRYNDMLKEKDSSLARLTASVAALEPLRGRVDALKDSLEQAGTRIKELETAATTAQPAPAKQDRDDLKKISGISRTLEKRLNDCGVRLFKQIAMWTKEDIDNLEKQMPELHNRVERDNWIASAQEQHLKKYGKPL